MIELYHSCHSNIDRNFLLGGLTTRHTPPDLTRTYQTLTDYMHANNTNIFCAGRKTAETIPDAISEGLRQLLSGEAAMEEGGEDQEGCMVEESDIIGDL